MSYSSLVKRFHFLWGFTTSLHGNSFQWEVCFNFHSCSSISEMTFILTTFKIHSRIWFLVICTEVHVPFACLFPVCCFWCLSCLVFCELLGSVVWYLSLTWENSCSWYYFLNIFYSIASLLLAMHPCVS